MHLPLQGRVLLVTGASRGIGRALALECAPAGARLALTGRDEAALQAAVAEATSLGAEARGYLLDVRGHGRVAETVEQVLADFGQIDALVNNAAVGKYASFLDLTLGDWEDMLAANLVGLVAVTRAVLPSMLSAKQGHIVNVSSIQGLRATATSSAYSATKFALQGLTQSLQLEFRRQGISITALCPGSVDTDFDGFPGSLKENPLTPQDVAVAIRSILETAGRAYVMESVLMPLYGP